MLIVGWAGTVTDTVLDPSTVLDPAESTIDQLLDVTFEATDRPEFTDLLADLSDAGLMVMLVVNHIAEAQEMLAARYLDRGLASALVNSAMVGVELPEPAFFELCLDVADCLPEEALYVDHEQGNLQVAAALGIQTVVLNPTSSASVLEAVAEIRRRMLT